MRVVYPHTMFGRSPDHHQTWEQTQEAALEDFFAFYFACRSTLTFYVYFGDFPFPLCVPNPLLLSSSLVREASQLFSCMIQYGKTTGFVKYFYSVWNVCDLLAPIAFNVGYLTRDSIICAGGNNMPAGRCAWIFAYSLSIAAIWLRVLRTAYVSDVGIVVAIFGRMFKDVMTFIVVYVLLLLVFSMLYLGTTVNSFALLPALVNGTCAPPNMGPGGGNSSQVAGEAPPVSCEWAWVFLLPLFQTFGELFAEEMQ
jgi:hypothetical protein